MRITASRVPCTAFGMKFRARQRRQSHSQLPLPRDLGFDHRTDYGEFAKAVIDAGGSLCPHVVIPELRLQYRDQPPGETLIILTEYQKPYYGFGIEVWPIIFNDKGQIGVKFGWMKGEVLPDWKFVTVV